MASALPEGQEALEVESACSENTLVGGHAHPVSSNTTEVGHTQLWGSQRHTVYCTNRRSTNTENTKLQELCRVGDNRAIDTAMLCDLW